MIAEHIAALLLGFGLDLFLGDPSFLWHPVCGIGWLISTGETFLRQRLSIMAVKGQREAMPAGNAAGTIRAQKERLAGIILVGFVGVAAVLIVSGMLYLAGVIHPLLRFVMMIIMSWQMLALKSLKTESMKVYHKLKAGDTAAARYALSMIVGRDTNRLDEAQIVKAAVETVAENTSDGVTAPFLFLLIGGPAAGFFYKAVNTMDSMIGYHSEKYEHFGRAAARLDDALNFIPARLSAVLMIAAAWILQYDAAGAVRIFVRDRFQHKSPNSAQTEAVCAGALGIQLAGDASYFGMPVKKPLIGDDMRPVEAEDIKRANRLLYGTAFLLAGITAGGFVWLLISTGVIFTAIR